jgi:hypothetical protein
VLLFLLRFFLDALQEAKQHIATERRAREIKAQSEYDLRVSAAIERLCPTATTFVLFVHAESRNPTWFELRNDTIAP